VGSCTLDHVAADGLDCDYFKRLLVDAFVDLPELPVPYLLLQNIFIYHLRHIHLIIALNLIKYRLPQSQIKDLN